MNTNVTELTPLFENVKSYYGKAKIATEGNKLILISYNSKVAEIEDGKLSIFNTSTATTLRHIREFLMQNGYPKLTKKEMDTYK